MGDLNRNPPPLSSLPQGCRFYPSDEQLLRYYLTPKANDDRRFGFDLIKDVDLYRYNPFDLPDTACFRFGRGGRKRHWYCYVAVGEGIRVLGRRAGAGYWKRRGGERDVVSVGAEKVVLGTRKSFVFYLGDSQKSVKTDWVMYEYALIGHHEASFVLCRVLVKLSRQYNGSNHANSSCGEEGFTTVRGIGVQRDRKRTSSIRKTVMHDDDSVDKKDEALGVTNEPPRKLDDQITARKVAGVELLPNEPATAAHDDLTSLQLTSILEDDYIELDDLSNLDEDYLELDDLTSPFSDFDLT